MEINVLYNTAQTIMFPVIKAGSTDFAVAADWTPAATYANYSIDGGTWTQCSSTVEIAVSGAAVWKLALSAAETTGSRIAIAIVDSATKAVEDQCLILNTGFAGLIEGSKGLIIGEVDNATFTATSTAMEAFRISPNVTEETTADHYIGRLITWTSGIPQGSQTDITDYVLANSKEKFTYTATQTGEAPGDADRFVIQ